MWQKGEFEDSGLDKNDSLLFRLLISISSGKINEDNHNFTGNKRKKFLGTRHCNEPPNDMESGAGDKPQLQLEWSAICAKCRRHSKYILWPYRGGREQKILTDKQ